MQYEIDEHDRISSVDTHWDEFAIANGAPSLVAEHVVGRDVWDYVSDSRTRNIWELLFRRARERGHVHVRIRCDAPALRRDLLVEVSSMPSGSLEVRTVALQVEPRPAQALLDITTPRTESLLRVCSWCKRVEVDREWFDVEEAAKILGLLQTTSVPSLTHGICPACHESLMQTLAEPAMR